jgi:hypothetical protein
MPLYRVCVVLYFVHCTFIHFLTLTCVSCESTCQSFRFECGSGGYSCNEDQATPPPTTDVTPPTCADQAGTLLGDGVCDLEFNVPFCNYDEGDCCESTCGLLQGITCIGPFNNCVDPNAAENAPSASPSSSPSASPSVMPSSTPSHVPSMSPSLAPSRTPSVTPTKAPSGAPSIDPSSAPTMAPTTLLTKICRACDNGEFCSDGFCDDELNNAACGWDGGDCCQETCEDNVFLCPTSKAEYVCRDPAHNGLPSTCTVPNPEWIGDGFCDAYGQHNTADCNFDGGDCCEGKCVKKNATDPLQCQYFFCTETLPPACAASLTSLRLYPPEWVG